LAYGIELRSSRLLRGDLMLRDGRANGFDIQLDDGAIVRVTKGRVRVVGGYERVRLSGQSWDQYIAAIDPSPPAEERHGPVPTTSSWRRRSRPVRASRSWGASTKWLRPSRSRAPTGKRSAEAA
jgi:hypothetical protein